MRRYGLGATVSQLAQALYRLLHEFLPWRSKTRFGDLEYDWEHAVDTTRSNVSFRTQLAATLTGHPYFASEPWIFQEMMQPLPPDRSEFTFVDLGSGKGRALLMAAAHGFRRVMGVELIPELNGIAQKNIAAFYTAHPASASIQSLCLDARDFQFPSDPLVVYLFNPFPEAVFAAVIENLRRSDADHPRPVWIAYRFPEFQELLSNCDWLEKVAGTEQWAVYRSSG